MADIETASDALGLSKNSRKDKHSSRFGPLESFQERHKQLLSYHPIEIDRAK